MTPSAIMWLLAFRNYSHFNLGGPFTDLCTKWSLESKGFLLLCRRLASVSCFLLFMKCSRIFRNASLLPLSNTSSSSDWEAELRILWCLFSSFFTKSKMSSSSCWNQAKGCVKYEHLNSTSLKGVVVTNVLYA